MVLKYNFGWSGQFQVCDRMKYKCFKSECPICHQSGSIQLFLNNKGEVRYARTRHSATRQRFQEATIHILQNTRLRSIENFIIKQRISLTRQAQQVKLVKQWDLKPLTHNLEAVPQFSKQGIGRVAQYG